MGSFKLQDWEPQLWDKNGAPPPFSAAGLWGTGRAVRPHPGHCADEFLNPASKSVRQVSSHPCPRGGHLAQTAHITQGRFLPWPFLLAKLLLRGRVPGDRAGEAGARQDRGRLLVSPTWRSRVLGRELVRNKVGSSSLFLHVAVAAETGGGCGSLPPLLP